HVRAHRVDWRLVGWMLPPSVVGAIAGGLAASRVPADALRIVIGTALLLFGIDLLRPRRQAPPPQHDSPDLRAAVVAGAAIGVLGDRLTGRPSPVVLLHAVGVILLVAGTAAIVQGVVS